MKNKLLALLFAASLITCSEGPDDQVDRSYFTKFIGARILFEDGERWVARYDRVTQNGRTQAAVNIKASTLRSFVTDLGSYIGLHFKYGIDEAGGSHILIIPKMEEGSQTSIAIDAGVDSYVALEAAISWAGNFVSENPTSIRSYFFGSHVFDEILSKEQFDHLELRHAISDTGDQELLLYAWNTLETFAGRKKSNDVDVYDMSSTCPTRCEEN